MKLDLTGILDNSVFSIDFEGSVEIDNSKAGKAILNPIDVEGTVYNTDDGIFLVGKVTYRYMENCARCLVEVGGEIEADISGKISEDEESKLEESDERLIAYNRDEIFLDDVILDAILLSMPMKVLCKEDCKGICPKCGKDLNKEECICQDEEIDPRLAKLKNFFE